MKYLLKKTCLASAISCAAMFATPALAAGPACGAGTVTATFADLTTSSYIACTGSWDGNLADNTAAAVANIITTQFGFAAPYQGKTGDAVAGPFANEIASSAVNSGVLTFAGVILGNFVIGLHGGGQDSTVYPGGAVAGGGNFSLYAFNGNLHGGITQVAFNMLGVSTNPQGVGQNLSHAALYGGTVAAIPEPETYALMLAGLGVIGFVARRRRPQD